MSEGNKYEYHQGKGVKNLKMEVAPYKDLCLKMQETNMLQLTTTIYLRKILPPRRDAVNYVVISA